MAINDIRSLIENDVSYAELFEKLAFDKQGESIPCKYILHILSRNLTKDSRNYILNKIKENIQDVKNRFEVDRNLINESVEFFTLVYKLTEFVFDLEYNTIQKDKNEQDLIVLYKVYYLFAYMACEGTIL